MSSSARDAGGCSRGAARRERLTTAPTPGTAESAGHHAYAFGVGISEEPIPDLVTEQEVGGPPKISQWLRAIGLVTAFLVVAVVVFVAVTASTGLSGPGPLRRYRAVDLEALATKINAQPDVQVPTCPGGHRTVDPQARVDLLRGRVVVEDRAITEMLSSDEQEMLSEQAFMPAAAACP